MFELYFGAFDVLLYAIAFITAVMVSGGICDAMEAAPLVTVTESPQCPALRYVSCEPSLRPTATIAIERPAVQAATAVSERPSAETQRKRVLHLSDIKLYKLHQRSVVLLSALPFTIPESIKRYKLRGEPVVRLESLQAIATVIA